MVLVGGQAKAQYGNGGQLTAGVNVGASLLGVLFSSISYADSDFWESTNVPAIQLSADYRMLDRLSVGGAFSFATTRVKYADPNLLPVLDDELSDFDISMNRINAAIRVLAYYTETDMVDLYSGLRMGVNIWGVNASSNDPDLDAGIDPLGGSFQGSFFGFQAILLGGTFYPVDPIGINFEFCIGQPYFASLVIKYRLEL